MRFTGQGLDVRGGHAAYCRTCSRLKDTCCRVSRCSSTHCCLRGTLPAGGITVGTNVCVCLTGVTGRRKSLTASLRVRHGCSTCLSDVRGDHCPCRVVSTRGGRRVVRRGRGCSSSVGGRACVFLISIKVVVVIAFFSLRECHGHTGRLRGSGGGLTARRITVRRRCEVLGLRLRDGRRGVAFLRGGVRGCRGGGRRRRGLYNRLRGLGVREGYLLGRDFGRSSVRGGVEHVVLSYGRRSGSRRAVRSRS